MASTRVHSRILNRYVLPGERVVVAIRHHWGRMIEPVASTAVALIAALWFSGSAPPNAQVLPLAFWWITFALVLRLLWKALEWRNEWFVATDKRLLMTYGLITHKVAMMPLRKVTDMNYARSPLGRLLGYGQFIMESAGQDQAMREINWVPDPDETYRLICDTIFGPEGHDPDDDIHLGDDLHSGDLPSYDRQGDQEQLEEFDPVGEPSQDSDGAWEVSRDQGSTYAPVGSWDDPDNTGPIPRPYYD